MQVTPNQNPRASGAYVGAALLIAIGSVLLIANLSGIKDVGQAIPLAIGLAFTAAYAVTRQYGFLVPGGILTGIGAGLVTALLAGATDNGPYVVLGGGLGFLLIYVADVMVSRMARRWWPLIPGGIMVVVAGGMAAHNDQVIRQVGLWSPLVLVVIGIWILIDRSRTVRH